MFEEQVPLFMKLVGFWMGAAMLLAFIGWLVIPLDLIRNSVRGRA